MKLKQISECRPDGKVSSFGYLVESASTDSLSNDDTTICNLGSLQAGGLQKLVELSNSINEYLLESALKTNRDSIASSKSYGLVYLVRNLLEISKISAEVTFGSDNPTKSRDQFDFLISLLAALLEKNIYAETKLTQVTRQVYFPGRTNLDPSSLYDLLTSIIDFPITSNNGDSSEYADKLVSWVFSDCGPWTEFDEAESVSQISRLAGFIQTSAEEKTGLSWDEINNTLRHLNVIQIEKENEMLLMTTRPDSSQLKLFYRSDIEIPPNVFREQTDQPISPKNVVAIRENIIPVMAI